MRLQLRNIKLTDEQRKRYRKQSRKRKKGVKDSLVLIDDIAFVVNVRNRTVITAVNSNELKETCLQTSTEQCCMIFQSKVRNLRYSILC